MKIAILSDLHITHDGHPIWGVDTRLNLFKAVEHLRSIDNLSAIFILGDLADDGLLATYKFVDEVFRNLGVPTYYCKGNHDSDAIYSCSFCQSHEVVDMDVWRFLFLDTTIPDADCPGKNCSRGRADIETIVNIQNTHNKRICVLSHHPSLGVCSWLDRRIIENKFQLRDYFSENKDIILHIAGHIHFYSDQFERGVRYITAPSVGFALSPNMPQFTLAMGEDGFLLFDSSSYNAEIKLYRI